MRNRYPLAAAALALLFSAAVARADVGYSATLDGAQEVPPVVTPASGTAYMTLDGGGILHYTVTYVGLLGTRTAAHFHGPALPGTNAAVVLAIAGAGPTSDIIAGTWAIDATNLTRLNAGQLYLNIHSTVFAGGELRGQVQVDATPNRTTTWGRIKNLYR
jgi:hypothetical protein